jgi:PPIC-type PPIASE domain
MSKSWLLCVLLGTFAWGQAQSGTTAAPPGPAQQAPMQTPGAATKLPAPAPAPEVAESAVVLTIKGVCPPAAKTAAATKTGAAKTATAAAKKPADCKTEITRAQFEKIASGISPNVTPQLKRQLETALPRFMAMSEAAKKKGLENSEQYKETLKLAKMQILTTALQRSLQEEADKVSPTEVEDYYKKNPEAYEQFSLDRLFIPRYKTLEAEDKDDKDEVKDKDKDDQKAAEEKQKAKEAEEQAKKEKGEQELNKLADSLRERAAAGEDFTKLQKEAFEASGTKVESPTVNLPKVRRTGLPPAHAAVFDLKVGEISAVISDNGGHYVYKVVSKEVLPLDQQLQTEIHNKMKSDRLKKMTDEYTNSFQAIPNEAYFGPAMPPGLPGRPGMGQGAPPPHMHPQMAPPAGAQSAPPPAQTPSQPAPPSKPD